MTRWLLAMAILTAATTAAAQTGSPLARPSGAATEFFVERSGGGYEVTVSPQFVTVFYLPERAIRALASNQKDFVITVMRDTVVVRPTKDERGLTANLNIDMKSMRISVVLKVGKPEEAMAQVIFSKAKEKAEIDRKVDEALAPLRAELERTRAQLQEEVRAAADGAIADAMAQGYSEVELEGIARDDANVIVRVPRTVRIGDSLYVQFTLQNRGGTPFLLRDATLVQAGKTIGGRTSFLPREGSLGKVVAGASGRGVLVVPLTALSAGKAFELRLTREPAGQALSVKDLRAP
jgi:hypothetical protein